MALPTSFKGRLKLPLVSAPMFLVSGPELVIETCKAGVVGTFPALNQRDSNGFEAWLQEVSEALEGDTEAAPYGVNLIVHKTNPRLQTDLELCVKYKVPLIITSLGAVSDVVDAIHSYGGIVFHDVINIRHAKKASAAGVDGLIAVCAGAGGHAGTLSPFALLAEIRKFYDKTVLLSGSLSKGSDILAAEVMGADLAYMGTRFINTQESRASDSYKKMIVDSSAADIVYTKEVSGVNANFLSPSLEQAGVDLANFTKTDDVDFGEELSEDAKAWKDIWSAGQGVGSIDNVPTVFELIESLQDEYTAARKQCLGEQ